MLVLLMVEVKMVVLMMMMEKVIAVLWGEQK